MTLLDSVSGKSLGEVVSSVQTAVYDKSGRVPLFLETTVRLRRSLQSVNDDGVIRPVTEDDEFDADLKLVKKSLLSPQS